MISVRNLTRYYGDRLAVDDVSFEVARGEIAGFLGPNGAGKTTIMRMLTGYLAPTSGEVRIGSHDMAGDPLAAKRLIGYLPESAPLYGEMTTAGYLTFAARLRGLDGARAKARVAEVMEACGLGDHAGTILRKLSKGYRQRVGLAQAIVHEPQVVILDEPTVGIDPIQIAETKALIADLGRDRTVLLSTHILPEVSALCDRVLIVNRGRVVAQDRIDRLSAKVEGRLRLRLTVRGRAEAVTAALRGIEGVAEVTHADPWHYVSFSEAQAPHERIAQAILAGGWTLTGMEEAQPSLEEVFLRLTRDEAAR